MIITILVLAVILAILLSLADYLAIVVGRKYGHKKGFLTWMAIIPSFIAGVIVIAFIQAKFMLLWVIPCSLLFSALFSWSGWVWSKRKQKSAQPLSLYDDFFNE